MIISGKRRNQDIDQKRIYILLNFCYSIQKRGWGLSFFHFDDFNEKNQKSVSNLVNKRLFQQLLNFLQ
jgi:hypothetical protein